MVLSCPYCERALKYVDLHFVRVGAPIAHDKTNMVMLWEVNHTGSPGSCEENFIIAEDKSGDRTGEDRFLARFKRPEHWNPPM